MASRTLSDTALKQALDLSPEQSAALDALTRAGAPAAPALARAATPTNAVAAAGATADAVAVERWVQAHWA